MTIEILSQKAEYPATLKALVDKLKYRPHWTFSLGNIDRGQGSEGLTLIIITQGYDTYHPDLGETYRVQHYFPVPPAAYDERSWKHWLLDCLIKVETHECCEFFQVGDSRPFAPHHGPGNDPYVVFDHGTDEDVRTSFRGKIKPKGDK